ncbi:MAG: tRNA (adenosine(37)-N6)-threonylcarbamoyltransferase complex ATPase subunit type 1 TsaE [Bacteroidetes bacterium 4484_276]|nr:MAG: tRNA (adenosine(37)-N6)-threonylcarbamoyltransferase complex ATPase subunit type 1 TsaE [Bacteroidetes bacterium 4484_276]OYT13878.1 MAG: tRNA (adenosine(37)-N6)-threonylcarbamoyltransferase complex ATPase subunit type 1 TsaE [Bacteroidetes bacterium 4572_114]
MSQQIISKSPGDLQSVAGQLIQAHPEARIFAFYGALGAGKTTFIKAMCKTLGVTDMVNSPTFALINQYQTKTGGPVYHFDFYRIRKIEEAMDMGYEDYFYGGDYCLIEWPEKIESLLPDETIRVNIVEEAKSGNRVFSF